MKIVRILSELQRRRRRRLLFSLWLCIIFASRVLNISAVPLYPLPVSVPVPVPVPFPVYTPNHLIDLCSVCLVISALLSLYQGSQGQWFNSFILRFSIVPIREFLGLFCLLYVVSCLVLSCLVCLPVRLSPSVISTFIYLSVADVKSFCVCHCLVHCKRHLVCTLKRNTLPPPPHTHTLPQSIVICSNFHLACTQIDSDKRKTRIPIAYMANMHSGKQPQCILGVVSQPGVVFLSQRLCKFTLCQLWLLFRGRCRNHKLIYYIKSNLITSWGSWADCSWRKMGEFFRITEIPGTATCWDFPSLGSLQWHND